jgi:type I restriction enzyme S subunit
MTMPLLVEHFDDLLATSEDMEQLNHVILQLAVQGKLDTHDQNDEPASGLLAAIHLQKPQKPSKKKMQGAEKVINIPENWVACPITELFDLLSTRGKQLQTKEYLDKGKYPIVSQGQELIVGYSDQDDLVVHLDKPVIIFGDHTREVKYIDFDFIAGADGIKVLNPIQPLNEKYFYLVLKSIHFESRGYARHFQKVTEILFPLPPLAEQQRIVARVEELFVQTRALAKELEHSKIELDGLNKSVLSHLLASETPEEFNQHWEFIAEHFDLLFQTPEHVAPLRQSILELAVRGKLTRREAGDESAGELLKRIGKQKFGKENEKPFGIPDGWEWKSFNETLVDDGMRTGPFGTLLNKSEIFSEGVPVFGIANVGNNEFRAGFTDFVTPEKAKALSVYILEEGDIVVARSGTVGRSCVVPKLDPKPIMSSNLIRIRIDKKVFLPNLMCRILNGSRLVERHIDQECRGSTRIFFTQKILGKFQIPVPSLAEQERIVKRVEQLLSLCDVLEGRLQSAEEERGRLVTAVMSTVGG